MKTVRIKEFVESKFEDNSFDMKEVVSAIPVGITLSGPMVILNWLCTTINGSLISICGNYEIENEHDEEFILMNPILEDRYFSNFKFLNFALMSNIPNYVTDFDFSFDDISKAHSTKNIYMKALHSVKVDEDKYDCKLIKIKVAPDVFAAMCYMDNYILSSIYNSISFHYASVIPCMKNDTDIFNVDEASLDAVYKIFTDRKNKTTGIIAKVTVEQYNENGIAYENKILLPLVINKVFKRKKFKNTLKFSPEEYFSNGTSYETDFLMNITLSEDNSGYLISRAKNNTNSGRIFIFKESILKSLENMIEEY